MNALEHTSSFHLLPSSTSLPPSGRPPTIRSFKVAGQLCCRTVACPRFLDYLWDSELLNLTDALVGSRKAASGTGAPSIINTSPHNTYFRCSFSKSPNCILHSSSAVAPRNITLLQHPKGSRRGRSSGSTSRCSPPRCSHTKWPTDSKRHGRRTSTTR